MVEIIAYCGLRCDRCPAYVATIENDDTKRKETAETWSKEFDTSLTAGDINCKGCHQDEIIFNYCAQCEIRKCGDEQGVETCAHCDEYICEKLSKFFEMAPEAKESLEKIRGNL